MIAPTPSSGRPPLVLAAGSVLDAAAADVIRAAAGAGFDAVGLRVTGGHRLGSPTELRRLAADHGMSIHDVEVIRIGDPTSEPDEVVERAIELGASAVLVVSDLADRAATTDRLVDLVERCRPLGLAVGLEYMAWTTPDHPDGAIAMADASGCTVVVDVLHHHRVGATLGHLERIVEAGVLGWMQICGAPARSTGDLAHEARHRRLVPGDGALPVVDLVAAVPASTPISVEVQSDELLSVPVDERARLLARAARQLLAHAGHEPSSTG